MRHAVSIQPISADISRALNEFGKRSRLHDIAVRAVGLTASEVMLVVRSGEDDNGDRGEARIGPEPIQQGATVLAMKVQVQEDQRRQGKVVCAIFEQVKCRLGILLGKEGDVEAGLDQRQAKQFSLARAVFDQKNGGMRHHL
jgi:hypothetical protein